MKNILIFCAILCSTYLVGAQNSHYENLWKKVEQFETDDLPKSALKIVEDIYNEAEKANNTSQFIKAMLFKSKFALILEEDAQLKIINAFKKEIEQNPFPTKNILESLLANLYWQYFNQNRWQFYNRTKTSEKVDPSTVSGQAQDFRTWDLQTLFDEIHLHYQNSLQNSNMLQLEALNTYDVLLNLQKDSKIYRPTLFDFLNHQALEFYKTNETHITKPAYKFEIDNSDFLCDDFTFSKLELKSKDSTSLQLNALKIYQDLIQFHIKNILPFALADVNIERLKFVNQYGSFSSKESLLLEVLKTESEKLKSHEVCGLYDFEIASVLFQQGQTYQPNPDSYRDKEDTRWKTKEAIDICNTVISKFPKSKGAEKCAILKQQIEQQTIQITTENFLPIQKNGRLLVRYKNIDTLQFHIIELKRSQLEKFNKIYRKDGQLAFFKKLDVDINWESKLKNENDYQTHSTEILVPKLNNGTYLIFAHLKNDDETFAFSTIQVTNLALVETESQQYKTFQIINRNNGKPISNASVDISYHENNNPSWEKESFSTNSFGEIKIDKNNHLYQNISSKVTYENDDAYFGNYYVNPFYKREKEKDTYKAFIFTDRSIYRPGQTVYFKAIALKTKNGKSEVVANESVYATLYNVNNEEQYS